jgi:hypothetical protein
MATTWYVPAVEGAVYTPAGVMVPPEGLSLTDQVTSLLVKPEIAAEKVTVWQASTAETDGLRTSTAVLAGGAVTVTMAIWDFDASA